MDAASAAQQGEALLFKVANALVLAFVQEVLGGRLPGLSRAALGPLAEAAEQRIKEIEKSMDETAKIEENAGEKVDSSTPRAKTETPHSGGRVIAPRQLPQQQQQLPLQEQVKGTPPPQNSHANGKPSRKQQQQQQHQQQQQQQWQQRQQHEQPEDGDDGADGSLEGDDGWDEFNFDEDAEEPLSHRRDLHHGMSSKENRPPPPPPGSLKALPQQQVTRFLGLVQGGDYEEALRALRKVRRAVKGRGCSKEAFGGMRALLHHLLEGYASGGRVAEAQALLSEMKAGSEARLVSAAAYNALLRGLLQRGDFQHARRLVREEMPRLGVAPNETSLNLLMDAAVRAGQDHEAWDILEEMQTRSFRADKYTVSILTKGISLDRSIDRRRVPRGVSLVERFLATQKGDVDEVLVNSLLDVFCRMGDIQRLEKTLAKMREYNIRGSAVTYGTIVKAYGKSNDIDKVLDAWEEMSRQGLEANAVTYGCMLDACVKCGHIEKALGVFKQMKAEGLHRNTILYATLIKGFAKSKDPQAARNLYGEMVEEGVPANVVVFNSLIDSCVRAGDLHAAAEVLQQMTAANVVPDLITFSTLIKGYCSSGELGKALRLAEELVARGLECDEIVYNSLLEGCVKAGDLPQGLRLFAEMRTHHVRPSSVTFSILVKLLSRAGRVDLACQLVQREMEEIHGITPTRMVWSCLLTCCVKARDLPKALAVLDVLEKDHGSNGGVKPSMYATVIEGCLAQGEISAALQLCSTATSKQADDQQAAQKGGWRDWSADRPISTDLLRRCFEAAGARGGPEEEAKALLPSLGNKLGSPVRQLLEEALSRGGRRREPRSHNRAPMAHMDHGNHQSWGSSGADHWPSQHRGGYSGMDGAWDQSQWGWSQDYNHMYFPGMEAYYGQNWQWGQPQWDMNGAAAMWGLPTDNPGAGATSLAPGVYTGPGSWMSQQTPQLPDPAAPQTNGADPLQEARNDLELDANSPSGPSSSPEQAKKPSWTPSTAVGSERTPSTAAGSAFGPSPHTALSPDSVTDIEGHGAEPMRLFASDGGDIQGRGQNSSSQSNRLLDGPPGLC